MAERLASGSEGQQVTPIEVPTKPTERGSIKLGLFARVFGVTAVVLALSLACKNAEDASSQAPNTSPPATLEISPTPAVKKIFGFEIPPESLGSWNEALNFVANHELRTVQNLVENEEITISTRSGAPPEDVAPAINITIKKPDQYLPIKEEYAVKLRALFKSLDLCDGVVRKDEYGTLVGEGIFWGIPPDTGENIISDREQRRTPGCGGQE